MSNLDLEALLEEFACNKQEIAKQLFPENQYPGPALNRVLKGESYLTTEQLKALAAYLGLPLASLFNRGWAMLSENGSLVFKKKEYKVYINYNGSFITVTKNSIVIKEEILNMQAISLCDFINYLNKLTDGTN